MQLEHESAVHSLEKSLKSEHAGEDGHEATVIIVSDKHDDLKIAVLGEELHGS